MRSLLISALERAVRHPGWTVEDIRGWSRRRAAWEFSLKEHAEFVADQRTALCEALSVSTEEYRRAVQADWWPPMPDDHQAGRAHMGVILRAVTRLLKPAVMVETGVARGVTTAVTLQALQDNGRGHLYSVDLPPVRAPAGYVGQLIPEHLRARWTLLTGPSRRVLPALLTELGEIDVFFHDAEHSYMSQMEEFKTAWPRLRPGGLLIADDVRNPAIVDFADSVGARPWIVGEITDIDGVGILRKPD